MLKHIHSILIVDDDRNTIKLLEKVLQRKYRTLSALSGEEALRILARENISLLITDHCMPGMTGTELIRQSRTLNPSLICMLMTGKTDVDVFIDALTKSRALRVINKPWDPIKIMQDIHTALEKHEANVMNKESMTKLREATESLNRLARINQQE